jgi:hypothetical protein
MAKTLILLCGAAFLVATAAQAAVITNLTDRPQSLDIQMENGAQAVTIAPQATWRVPGKLVIRYHDRDVRLEEVDEYAIWPNAATGGVLGPQNRITHGKGNLG